MPYVTTDDNAEVHYLDSGGEGPVVLLLHGVFVDSEMWAPQVRSLAPDYRIIRIDARGHGKTTDPGVPFDYWRLAWDCWAVVNHLGIEKLLAVGGQFQGGWIAMRMALQHPSRVRGLILIGTTAAAYTTMYREAYEHILMNQWILGDAPLPSILPPIAAAMVGGDLDRHRQYWLDRWYTEDRRRYRLAGRCLIDRESIEPLVGTITAPALLMHGEGDQTQTLAVTSELARQLGGLTRVETIHGTAANHMCTWTHPEQTDPLIREFLDSLGQ